MMAESVLLLWRLLGNNPTFGRKCQVDEGGPKSVSETH